MKVTRSYWFGLGSGLILSAILTILFSPQQIITDVQSVVNSQTSIPMMEHTTPTDASSPVESPGFNPEQNMEAEESIPARINRDFVVPKGTNAEQIADLLFAQDFIKDKAAFLEKTHQMRAETRFRAGTFSLSWGLTEEELIYRLLK